MAEREEDDVQSKLKSLGEARGREAEDLQGSWRCWACGTTKPDRHAEDCDPEARSYTLSQAVERADALDSDERNTAMPEIETVPASQLRAGDVVALRVDQVLGPNPETGKIELSGVEAGPLLPEQEVWRVR